MSRIWIDYQGRSIIAAGRPTDTHVVVSTTRNGDLRVQPTQDVVAALEAATKVGDADRRVALIEDGRAVFAVAPTPVPVASEGGSRDRGLGDFVQAVVVAVLFVTVLAILALS